MGVSLGLGLEGCGGLEPVAEYSPITDPEQLYTKLTLNYGAINLSTAEGYNTIQLVATPRNALGEPLVGLPAPTFSSLDTASVKVTPEGLVTARKVANNIQVVADLAIPGNVRRADTALIRVTLATPVLDTFIVRPLPPDSAVFSLPFVLHGPLAEIQSLIEPTPLKVRPPRAVSPTGNVITGLLVEIWSLDSSIAIVDRRTRDIVRRRPGSVSIVARTMAYGVPKTDTALFTVTGAISKDFDISRTSTGVATLAPSEVTILPSGVVFWENRLAESVEVIFDDPTNVVELGTTFSNLCNLLNSSSLIGPGPTCGGTGDFVIPPNPPGKPYTVRARKFPVPGIYPFRTSTGLIGKVIVSAPPGS